MNIISQVAHRRQSVVKLAKRKGKSFASRIYGVSLSSVKRWCARYDGTWQSLKERSHRPKSHPQQHTEQEEEIIRECFKEKYMRYGWDGVYDEVCKKGYTRSYSGMIYAAKRMKLTEGTKKRSKRRNERRFPERLYPGEKVQIDVKEVPYFCLRGEIRRNGKHLYQWTAIDECTRYRFIYGFEEHTPENSVKFLKMLEEAFPFKIKQIQTDNGTEFTYKYISDNEKSPFEKAIEDRGIVHVLIPPRTPWHNGKVERSHRSDQRYFYEWEKFHDINELNTKLKSHLEWSNNKTMRILGRKSPLTFLFEKLAG